jgi:hypothetical protein
MNRKEVYAALGPPLYATSFGAGRVIEEWTTLDPKGHCSLFVRQIWFQGDTVIKKVAKFSPD